jgi:glutamate transport system substrate-binding protein
VKYDQPGIGRRQPGADAPEGFDIEIGRIIADRLGIDEVDITWVEAVSDSREQLLEGGSFDLVIASYSITDERRELVGQAGPYFLTGQQLLVRTEDAETIAGPDDLGGVPVCSVTGSTSLERVETEYAANPVGHTTYSECLKRLRREEVDAVTTDGAILLGYAARQPDLYQVVGEPFSEERYGIGYPQDADGMCEFLTEVLETSFEDDSWAAAFESTLGQAGVETPEPPELDPCP